MIEQRLPFTIRSYDNDNGSEFINTDFITHLQQLDIQQTRSRPYQSRNNHVVRKHAFYYRHRRTRPVERAVRSCQGQPVHPVQETRGSSTRDGRPRRVYDQPTTPGETQTIRRAGPGRRRHRVHPARATRPDRTSDRRDKPGRARPPHPRHPGPARRTPPRTRRLENASAPMFGQDMPRSRASDRRPQRNTSRHRLGFRAHFQ